MDGRMTYVGPDGHDQHHGQAQGLVELGEAADLVEAVAVVEDLELVGAKLGGDGAARRDALEGRGRDLNLLVVLDEELSQLIILEASDDAMRTYVSAWSLEVEAWPASHRTFMTLITTQESDLGIGTHVNFLLVSTFMPLP
jgi:hypothetical protein